jgi:DNA-binding NtrC family response regulator
MWTFRFVPPPCNDITIVVVDDDIAFRSGLAANLADDGHVVAEYGDPQDVPVDVLGAARVVVTDYQMAAIDGLTFADRVHALRPETAIVLATAYWTIEIEAAVAERNFVRLCRKPVDYEELHTLVHEITA